MEINKKIFKFTSIGICLFYICNFNAYAANKMTIISEESTVTFIATQNNAPVSGNFNDVSGTIHFSPDDLKSSKVNVEVDTNSISAPFTELKEMLITNDWFNTKLYPKAKFVSNKIIILTKGIYQSTGLLTIKNIQATVEIKFKIIDVSENKIHFFGRAKLKRLKFSIGQGEWSSTTEIANQVKIKFSVMAYKI